MSDKFYLTTPIYYVNDVPHLGHLYTTLAGDVIARYQRLKIGSENVFFLTGTDEHGLKVSQSAAEKGISPKEYVDSIAPRFEEAWKLANVDYDYFIRTTDPKHEKVVSEVIQKIYDNGFVYEGTYEGLYCVGCESFKTETELINGKCPLHPNKEPIHQKEKNYFLKLKELSKNVLKKIEKNEYLILPEERRTEIISRLKQGVEDISISRSSVDWGIPIPWDKDQTVFVWVDALINYYSATRFIEGKENFWPANLHIVGKDILWFHAVVWEALLIAAEIELPRTIYAHGFFTIEGQKMSKSLGNVISPKQLVERYGVDGTRYLVLSAYAFGADGDVSISKFDEKYNADLANGIGNLVSRVAKLCENSGFEFDKEKDLSYSEKSLTDFDNFRFDMVLNDIWSDKISKLDQFINEHKVWEQKGDDLKKSLSFLVQGIQTIAFNLKPFMPSTADAIEKHFSGGKIKSGKPLFPRI